MLVPFRGAAAKSGTGARRSARRVLRRCRPAALGSLGSRVASLAAMLDSFSPAPSSARSARVRRRSPLAHRQRKELGSSPGRLARFARSRLALWTGLREGEPVRPRGTQPEGRAIREPRAETSLGRGAHSVARLCLISRLRRETAQARSLRLRGCGLPTAGRSSPHLRPPSRAGAIATDLRPPPQPSAPNRWGSGWRGSNPRLVAPKATPLPTEVHPAFREPTTAIDSPIW